MFAAAPAGNYDTEFIPFRQEEAGDAPRDMLRAGPARQDSPRGASKDKEKKKLCERNFPA